MKDTHNSCSRILEQNKLLRRAVQETMIFFQKTIQNFKSFLYSKNHKLPKTHPPLNPLYCCSPNMQKLNQFNGDFSEQRESNNDPVIESKKTIISAEKSMNEEKPCIRSIIESEEQSATKSKLEKGDEKKGSYCEEKGDPHSQIADGGCYVLARKMKELEMMDVNDMDQVLDIEEVLHYYSRLKSPLYLDIVDNFFMDMHSEFFLPQPSLSISNSSRRLGHSEFFPPQPCVSISNSSRRLGPLKFKTLK